MIDFKPSLLWQILLQEYFLEHFSLRGQFMHVHLVPQLIKLPEVVTWHSFTAEEIIFVRLAKLYVLLVVT